MPDKISIGIIGAGLMGHSLAQLFAGQGHAVWLYDTSETMLASAPERIRKNFRTFLELGLATDEDMERCLAGITLCSRLDEAVRDAGLIIEAVNEKLPLKQQIFAEVEGYVGPETLLCTNTSAISITSIAEALKGKERFLGTHFWNPPHIVPCVEVIKSEYTSDEVFETVYRFMKQAGKRPVKVLKDVPGFLGNRMQHALWREAASLLQAGIASAEDIDTVVKCGFGLRLAFIGPLETADLAGLDLTQDVQSYLLPFLETSPFPPAVMEDRIKEGKLGVKTGEGFHQWPQDKADRIIKQRDRVLLQISRLVGE
ncbi:MAG: hypothetical protein LDL33_08315 [Desulfomonile sp.]|nr:hypothetical protein [Desulfomonile sp.]